jgi:hypothetical protein
MIPFLGLPLTKISWKKWRVIQRAMYKTKIKPVVRFVAYYKAEWAIFIRMSGSSANCSGPALVQPSIDAINLNRKMVARYAQKLVFDFFRNGMKVSRFTPIIDPSNFARKREMVT